MNASTKATKSKITKRTSKTAAKPSKPIAAAEPSITAAPELSPIAVESAAVHAQQRLELLELIFTNFADEDEREVFMVPIMDSWRRVANIVHAARVASGAYAGNQDALEVPPIRFTPVSVAAAARNVAHRVEAFEWAVRGRFSEDDHDDFAERVCILIHEAQDSLREIVRDAEAAAEPARARVASAEVAA